MTFFRCPDCGAKLRAKPELAGRQFRCPQCRSLMTVPTGDASGTRSSGALQVAETAAIAAASESTDPTGPTERVLWAPGTVLLDDFVVEELVGSGGMGDVYRVRSRLTSEPFAVKRVLPRLLRNEKHRKAFLQELRTWIDLPSHPHLTACRFFRTVEDQVIIFAEYVSGGSLSTWIREGRTATLESVLDVAIQVAWALDAAHQHGLIHQDVKPANILMTEDLLLEDYHRAKVTDFGLAKALALVEASARREKALAATAPGPKAKTTGAGTPAYCSPEQASGAPVSPRADVWGWAVSILEMLLGKRTWIWGYKAAEVFEQCVKEMGQGLPVFRVVPPKSLLDLLERCFRRNPANRWQSMREAADAMAAIYEKEVGRPYHRPYPVVPPPLAATTYLRRTRSGATWSDPRVWLQRAEHHQGGGYDPTDWLSEATSGSRRARAIDDLIAYDRAHDLYSFLLAEGHRALQPEMAALCFQKALVHQTAGDVAGALVLFDEAIRLYEPLAAENGTDAAAQSLAECYTIKARTLANLGKYESAVELFDRAIAIQQPPDRKSPPRNADGLADCLSGRALAVMKMGDYAAALGWFDRAIPIREQAVYQEGRAERIDDLANAYRDKALALVLRGHRSWWQAKWHPLDHLREAVALYDRAIELYNRPGAQETIRERAIERAKCFVNKGNALVRLGDAQGALQTFDYAVAFLQPLERQRVQRELAIAMMSKAIALGDLKGESAAIGLYDQATEMLEQLVRQESRPEFTYDLAMCSLNKGCALAALGDDLGAVVLVERALKQCEHEVQAGGHGAFEEDLALACMNKSIPLGKRGQTSTALELCERATHIRTRLAEQGHRGAGDDLGLILMNQGAALWRAGQKMPALSAYNRAIAVIRSRQVRPELRADVAVCYMNKALAYHQIGLRWAAAWALSRAERIVADLLQKGGPVGDPALELVRARLTNPSARTASTKKSLQTQSLVASRGAFNRARKKLVHLF